MSTIHKNPVPGIRLSMQYVDPVFAKRLLATNVDHQRTMSSANLKKIEGSLRKDQFVVNGQSMIVDEDGKLLDGQHRLQACINTGIGFWTVYVSGIPREYFKFMDCGKARTFADVLKTTGHSHIAILGATVQRLAEYLRSPRTVGSATVFAHSELMDVLEMSSGLEEAVRAVQSCKSIMAASQCAWLYYLASQCCPEQCREFFNLLGSGEMLAPTSPILQLRKRIINNRVEGHHFALRDAQAVLIKAWNAYIEKKAVKQMIWQGNEDFPVLILPGKVAGKGQAA